MRRVLFIGLLIALSACTQKQPDSSNNIPAAGGDSSVVETEKDLDRSSVENSDSKPVEKVFPSETFSTPATLVAENQDAQINLRAEPSIKAESKGYGLVGDQVTALGSVQGEDGSQWYQVKFESSGAKGWIKETFVAIGNVESISETNQPSSVESKASLANLSLSQAQELLSLDKNNRGGIDMKIVLPTYVPTGYRVKKFLAERDRSIAAPHYEIVYANDLGNCFEISAASGGFGANAVDFESVTVNSKALGTVELSFTQFDSVTDQDRIGLKEMNVEGIIPSDQRYSFWSPGNNECETIDFQEAVKIVESLDYLNP